MRSLGLKAPDFRYPLGSAEEPKLPEAEWPEWSGTVRAAWQALRDDRWRGAMGGLTGIYYAAISRYARDHGISGDDFARFHAFVTALDAEYLAFENERAKAEAEKRDNKPSV